MSSCIIRRLRRRGPRSQLAFLRRSVPKHRRALPDTCLGESRQIVSDSNSFASSPSNRLISNASNNNLNSSVHETDDSTQSIADEGIHIYFVNIRCLSAHLAELSFHLASQCPHVVCIQETWLDLSTKDEFIPEYAISSRRDRHAGSNRGGILTLYREDFNGLVHITDSVPEERSWYFSESASKQF